MRLFNLGLCFSAAFVLSSLALAQSPTPTPIVNTSTLKKAATTDKSTAAWILGFKSLENSGRIGTINDDGARVMKSKNEIYLGYRLASGWGGYAQGVQTYNSYKNNPEKSKWAPGDSSLTLLHPDWYQSPTVTIFGQFRYYFPTTEWSVEKSIQQVAYYFRTNFVLAPGHELYNEIIPRYFDNKIYDEGDTTTYVEDTTIYGYKVNKSLKVGFRSWAQWEYHVTTDAGYSIEAGPHMVYSFNSNLNISSGVSFPLAVQNKVYDGPKTVGTDQAYVDIFIQAKL